MTGSIARPRCDSWAFCIVISCTIVNYVKRTTYACELLFFVGFELHLFDSFSNIFRCKFAVYKWNVRLRDCEWSCVRYLTHWRLMCSLMPFGRYLAECMSWNGVFFRFILWTIKLNLFMPTAGQTGRRKHYAIVSCCPFVLWIVRLWVCLLQNLWTHFENDWTEFWCTLVKAKGEGKGLDTCYSATYMNQTRDQQRFTISEVAADWLGPIVPQRVMWPSIARANGQLDPQCS